MPHINPCHIHDRPADQSWCPDCRKYIDAVSDYSNGDAEICPSCGLVLDSSVQVVCYHDRHHLTSTYDYGMDGHEGSQDLQYSRFPSEAALGTRSPFQGKATSRVLDDPQEYHARDLKQWRRDFESIIGHRYSPVWTDDCMKVLAYVRKHHTLAGRPREAVLAAILKWVAASRGNRELQMSHCAGYYMADLTAACSAYTMIRQLITQGMPAASSPTVVKADPASQGQKPSIPAYQLESSQRADIISPPLPYSPRTQPAGRCNSSSPFGTPPAKLSHAVHDPLFHPGYQTMGYTALETTTFTLCSAANLHPTVNKAVHSLLPSLRKALEGRTPATIASTALLLCACQANASLDLSRLIKAVSQLSGVGASTVQKAYDQALESEEVATIAGLMVRAQGVLKQWGVLGADRVAALVKEHAAQASARKRKAQDMEIAP